MQSLFSTTCLLGFVMVISACSHNPHTEQEARQEGPSLDPSLIIAAPADDKIETGDLTIRQVERKTATAETNPWDKSLTVEQLNTQSPGGPGGFAFDAVKGDHPCRGARVETDACQAASKALAEAANAKNKSTQGTAEAELQTLTNQVIDPDTFDPLTTIDEIGRGDQFSSLAAQAVGSEFLAPTIPEAPVEDAVDPAGAASGAGLPPFVLDITVTQGTPSPPPTP